MSGICLLAALSFAQSDRGTITGTVLDPGGAVIPGASVTATNAQTGTATRGETTATGAFTLLSLPAGEYELAIEADGFNRSVRQGIRVGVAQTARLDVVLEIGATTETITITADAPLLQTESAEQSTNISGEMFNSLPLNFGGGGGSSGNIRGWLGFIQLAPGVSGNDHRAAVNGAPGGSFKIYLEGQDVTSTNDTVWTSTVAAASVETIGDFTMQTSNYSAEFGQVMGGVFNFTTKSGTNELHGSAYDYFTNEALDAHRPFSQARPVNRKHDYGFTVGGPVYIPKVYDGRNRTFFFFGYERFRNNTTSAGTLSTVPTAAYRQGDFSQALTGRQLGTDELGRPIMENQLYDPNSTYITPGGVQMRDPIANNLLPQSRLDPVSLKVQALIPSPDNGDLVSNWDPRIPGGRVQSIPSLKIDHAFTDNAKISGYYSVQNTEQITANDGLPIPITGRRDQLIFGKTFRVNYDQTLSPTVLMHLGAGYLRFHNPDSSPLEVLEYDAVSGIGFTGAASDPSGFPRVTGISGAANRGGSPSLGPNQANRFWNDKLTSVASLTWVKNNHNYKFGGEFKQEVWTDVNLTRSQGGLDFDAAQTALPSPLGRSTSGGSTGYDYASFLLGLADSAQVAARRDPQWRKKAWSFYAQDNWKITRKLTLDYGLRYDLAGTGHEIYYRTSVVDTKLPNPSAGNLPGAFAYEGYGPGRCDCRFSKTYPYAFGPRLGLAYQIDDKTVLRAGWGLSYSGGANWWYVTGGSNQLGLGFNSIDWTTAEYGGTAVRFRDGLQYDRGDLYTATLDPGIRPTPGQLNVPSAWGGQINDRNGGRPGRVNQWNISLQREIARDLTVDVSYVANRAVWLEANGLVGVNAIRSADLTAVGLDINNADDRSLLRSRIDSPLAASRGFSAPYAGYPGGATVAQTLRPFPQFNDNLATRWAPLGKTWYDSLQIKLNKRYSHGFDMTAAFTYQRERGLGTGGNPSPNGPTINNIENYEAQKGLMSTSQPYIFVVGFNYDSPGLGTNKYLRAITKDWTFGGVLRYASGSLIGAPSAQNNLNQLLFQGNSLMNRVESEPLFLKDPNCGCIDPFKDFIYNPAAWANPPDGQFGNAQGFYDEYRWQHQVSESLNLGRRFRIWESVSFEVRAEFFNVFNRLFLPIPGGNNPLTNPAYSSSDGRPTNGFGFINPFGNPQASTTQNTYPRSGQIVARIQF
jgi:hypothetical protein